jgi:hypothetical protein
VLLWELKKYNDRKREFGDLARLTIKENFGDLSNLVATIGNSLI